MLEQYFDVRSLSLFLSDVQLGGEPRQNRDFKNIAPGSYESPLNHLKKEPQWR